VLLAITYTLVAHATVTRAPLRELNIQRPPASPLSPRQLALHNVPTIRGQLSPALADRVGRLLRSRPGQIAVAIVGSKQRIADLHELVIESVIALAIMAVICAALGWLVAGRVLRPLRTMTASAQQISEVNLHQRLALTGPRDELRQLGDTIDGLLERLERAFDAQRRFVANASHELRTPLTAARALLEMIISDPDATVQTFRATCQQVLQESEQQEQLIDALLALAHGQRGIDHPEPIDLATVAGAVLRAQEGEATARGLHLDVSLDAAPMSGDRRLIERLASNLLENAVRHNLPHGRVRVLVEARSGRATLAMANTGPLVPADEVDRLLQPFQRLGADRVGRRDGLGLGLSIVAAIATAHDGELDVQSGQDGGLRIEVRFPPPPTRDPRANPAQPLLGPSGYFLAASK
jgi:signal transduction histidine kinase